jgi:predicted GIY-YIG superfamily endonuclease
MTLKNITTQTTNFKAIYSYGINTACYSTTTPAFPVLIENQTTAVAKFNEVPSIDEIKSRAVKVFEYPVADRKEISSFLKGKSGVYLWLHKENGKYYIGSSVDLRYRFYDYFSKSYFYKSGNTIIANAISKYGLGAFEFAILEFTEKDAALSREQKRNRKQFLGL